MIKLSLQSPNLGFFPWWDFLLFPVPYPDSQDVHLRWAAQGTLQSKMVMLFHNGNMWKAVGEGGETFLVCGFGQGFVNVS